MAEMLSAGVYVEEIDASTIAPTVSNSICVFAGDFVKGPVEQYVLITTVDELISFFGLPTDSNYNDWYQCWNLLQYGNKLYVARASNVLGTATVISGVVVDTAGAALGDTTVPLTATTGISVGDLVSFGASSLVYYEVVSIVADTSVTLDRGLEEAVVSTDVVNSIIVAKNGVFEAVDTVAAAEAVTNDYEYLDSYLTILNSSDFETKETSIAFANSTDSKLKIIARNPGTWSEDLEIAIATPSAFGATVPSTAFAGIALDELFEYAPTGTQVGIVVKNGDIIEEIFTVDFVQTAKDSNGKSNYIETVINNQSNLIFVKDNTANTDAIKDYCATVNGVAGSTISLVGATDSAIQADDLLVAYELWSNKEEIDIDIVIGNETDGGQSAFNLCDTRKDCIGFFGAYYGDVVGKKASDAVSNLKARRSADADGVWDENNMFAVICGNYKYQYDKISVA